MTACVCCTRPMPDQAYACIDCSHKGGQQLDTIVDMTPAARDVAHGQSRRGGGGAGSGKPGSRLPFDLGATAKLDAVQNELSTLMRHVAGERGLGLPAPLNADPVVVMADWLGAQLEWIRHRPEADETFATIAAAARVVAGIARGPREQKYLGPCGAPSWCDASSLDEAPGTSLAEGAPCEGDVYGPVGGRTGACRTCGAQVAQDERRAWLDGEVRDHAFRASHIAEAYGVNVNTIRTWASRPRRDTGEPGLASYWRTGGDLIVPWVDPAIPDELKGEERERREAEIDAELAARGPRLHYVGDVLDLAAADAARRAEDQAKRARRAAEREAIGHESEDAA